MFPKTPRRVLTTKAPLRVIMGDPRIPLVKKSANDNAQNQSYQFLTDVFQILM
jgi:predicted helicase